MRYRSIAAAFTAALILTPAAFAADTAKAAKFSYVGYMGGVKIGWANAEIATGPERYSAQLQMETGGLVGWFVEWRHVSAAIGAPVEDGAAPIQGERYKNAAFWKEKERFIDVAYQGDLPEIAEATPHPVTGENRPAVPEDVRRGALDPISAIVAIGQTLEKTGSCATSFGVYDGRRQYLLKVEDEGEVEIGRSRYAPYGGDVRKCIFVFERVAGFKKKNSNDPTRGRAYYRRAHADAPMMPVQIAAETKYGAAIMHLRELDVLDPALTDRPIADVKAVLNR